MKLGSLSLCLDCEEVYEATRHGQCPVCGSRASYPIYRWLRPRLAKAPEGMRLIGYGFRPGASRVGAEVARASSP